MLPALITTRSCYSRWANCEQEMTTMQLINMLTLSMDYTTQYLNVSAKCSTTIWSGMFVIIIRVLAREVH